ncbi:hypothetical protein B566_EDAN004578 [Ephemera danica]|nr:hypothetical protein B566_EDAN004578 [Ephemera danica]
MLTGRALHFVFKVGDRKLTDKFYRQVLGMKILRHEEFSEGCDAACNGPYNSRWSKTMVGYGPEDTNFVVELTFNYGIKSYEKGNDFLGMTIKSREAIQRARDLQWPIEKDTSSGLYATEAPGGYKFYLEDEPQPTDADPVQKVTLACSNLQKSIDYWHGLLGLKLYNKTSESAVFGFSDMQVKLEMKDKGQAVDHGKAYGRIAFSCPHEEQPALSEKMEKAAQPILTPLITLDTPGKASVRVIILADPDGHEICFVDDEGFRELSQVDPQGTELLERYMAKEK